MIRFQRPDAPDCLKANANTWRDDWVAKRIANPTALWNWRDKNCSDEIREVLDSAHDGHCAFCDDFGAKSEIEHFFSKTGSPQLAYEWTNLFPACHDCNFEKGAKQPRAFALRPDNATFLFTDYFYVLADGCIEINPALSEDKGIRATELRDLYRLNRRELCESRRDQIDHPSRSPKRFRFLPRSETLGAPSSLEAGTIETP